VKNKNLLTAGQPEEAVYLPDPKLAILQHRGGRHAE
jgi:hypothetical protein